MGTNRYDIVDYDDLRNWYTQFNRLVSYSSGLSTLTVPADDRHSVRAREINDLHSQITNFQNDYYLGTQAAWWPTGVMVNRNQIIEATSLGAITTTVSNVSRVKCKNTATNSHGGMCENTMKSNSAKINTNCSQGQNSNTYKAHHVYDYGMWENGVKSSGAKSAMPCSSGACTSGSKTSGTYPNTLYSNGWNGSGLYANVVKTCGAVDTNSTSSGTITCNHGYNTCGRYQNGANDNTKHSNGTNGHNNNSNVTLSNGDKANGYNSNGACENRQTSSRSIAYIQCFCGTYSNGVCTSGWHSCGTNSDASKGSGVNMCGIKTNTTTIDITCSSATKTNG